MCSTWCMIRMVTCVSLMLMFLGTAQERALEVASVVPKMSEQQVYQAWGDPDRIVASASLIDPPDKGSASSCIWIYYNPYRLVMYEDERVVRCFEAG